MGAVQSAPDGKNLQAAVRFYQLWASAWRFSPVVSKLRMRNWKVITCGRWLGLWLEACKPSFRLVACACSSLLAEYCGTLHINESVLPNKTSSGSLASWNQDLTPWKYLSCDWWNPTRRSFRATSWMASKIQDFFPCLQFPSSQVLFSGHSLWPSTFGRRARLRNDHLMCEHNAWRPPSSSMLHYHAFYIDHTYRLLKMPGCTQLGDWIWDAEQGFRIVETGWQLPAGTSSFPLSESHSIETLPHRTYLFVWGCGKLARITRLHCPGRAIRASLWSCQSTTGGGEACWLVLNGGGRA